MLFGGHCSGGVKKALDRAQAIGADCVQLFVQSPRAWRFPQHDPADLERFRARREETGQRAVAVHALYLVNLASPQDDLYVKSVETMRHTVDAACAIGADAVVFHVGSHLGTGFEAGLERVVPALELVLERCADDTWLCLENSAGAGGTIGRSVEELAVLVERLDRHPRLGVCLDSCHLWVSGWDVTDADVLARLVEEVDERIGLDRLRLLHANDAAAPLGSNRDRHANVGEGLLGEGLGTFLAHAAFQELPALLEVPGTDGHGPDADQVRKLRELHARATSVRPPRRRKPRSKAAK
ncbi:MAG TPA: deoxyribonuclease IV [Gaiellaceae bacterium]|nr:deoxyribonuclease IV [Gaiellaceae bacterium]